MPPTTYTLNFKCNNCGHRFKKTIPVKHQVTYSYGVGANVIFNFMEDESSTRDIISCPNCLTTADVRKEIDDNDNDKKQDNHRGRPGKRKKSHQGLSDAE